MLRIASDLISKSRRGRYWMKRLANHDDLQAVVNLANDRVEAGLRSLARMGFSPRMVVDVGAHTGEWTRAALPYFPNARFVMIEAQPDKEEALRRMQAAHPQRLSYIISLLGREPRTDVEFFLADTGSSLYPENTSFSRQRTILPMTTLDLALDRHPCEGDVFLKLDVQGAELDILAGGERTLARTDVLLMEVSLAPYNDRAPRVAEVVAEMARRDFLLFDIWDLRRIGPILAQADFVFARRGSLLERHALAQIQAYGR